MNFIIGKYGSGKSALLNSILNEMDRLEETNFIQNIGSSIIEQSINSIS
jgi:ABC-type lipoprotein export system ATPase subunit